MDMITLQEWYRSVYLMHRYIIKEKSLQHQLVHPPIAYSLINHLLNELIHPSILTFIPPFDQLI